MYRRREVILGGLSTLLVGCGQSDPPRPVPPVPPATTFEASLDPAAWAVTYSPGMPRVPARGDAGWELSIPIAPDTSGAASLHYVTTTINRDMRAKFLELTFKMDVSDDAVFQYKLGDPGNTCVAPARTTVILQRRGDQMTAEYEDYRWFSTMDWHFKDSQVWARLPLMPEAWYNVFAKNGATRPTAFAACLANLGSAGMVFGGGCFAGHGINLQKGVAKFTLQQFNFTI